MVSDAMRIGGRTMAVRAFNTEDTLEEVVEFYQEFWQEPPQKHAPGYTYEPDAIAPWHLVTRVEDGVVMTVQVQPAKGGGAWGYLAAGQLPEPGEPPAAAPQLPVMDGSQTRCRTSRARIRARTGRPRSFATNTRATATSIFTASISRAGGSTWTSSSRATSCTRYVSAVAGAQSSSPFNPIERARK